MIKYDHTGRMYDHEVSSVDDITNTLGGQEN